MYRLGSNNVEIYREYCTGCGLCHSVKGVELSEDKNGFFYPLLTTSDIDFCNKYCAFNKEDNCKSTYTAWGNIADTYIGWAKDQGIRDSSSSGGAITAICCNLLESGVVDGIIQTCVGEDTVYSTKTVVSRTTEAVKNCMGSRYAASSPLYDILQMINEGEKYAFVGKPCDVQSLRNYLKNNEFLNPRIPICISFFCAGIPSTKVQKKLLSRLGCEDEKCCFRLDYRGNGWPGFATAYKKDGTYSKVPYEESWGRILGRDIRKNCKFCIDGIGEYADIVCADAWHNKSDGSPDFSEHQGRNLVIVRNSKGKEIVESAAQNNRLHIEPGEEYIKSFKQLQKFQYERRGTMRAMLLALKLAHKTVPCYSENKLKVLSKNVSVGVKARRFFGTLKRIKEGKI